MSNEIEPFWMVYGEHQGPPTMRHASRVIADGEAKRLARNNPGIRFFVLESVAVAEKHDVSFTTLTRRSIDDEIPF
jgi:hypothetical protein